MFKKTKMLLVFSLLLASLAVTPVFASDNILTNGGFENYASGQTATGWNVTIDGSPQSAYVEMSTIEVASGTYSQRISQDGSTFKNDELGIESDYIHGVVPGKTLRLSFKSNIVSMAGAELIPSVKFWDANDDYLGKIKTTIKTTTSGWQEFSHVVTIPANSEAMAVGFEVPITQDGGYYNLFLDDVSLVEEEASNDQTQVGILPGTLSFNTVSGSFVDIPLTNWDEMETVATTMVTLTDDTGSGAGWSVKISATSFVSSDMPDPSSNGNATYALEIPISALKLETSSLTHFSGQAIDPVHGPIANSFTVSGSSQTLVKADPGFGSGSYLIPIEYTLNIPKTLKIVRQSGTGSKFNIGDYVGVRSDTYVATLNFTAGTGL